MLNKIISCIIRKRHQYTSNEISNGLDALVDKVAKISLSARIISPMFERKINDKEFTVNRETMPLVIILNESIRYIYGRLGRCYFDGPGKDNNTASLKVLYDQIFNAPNGDSRKITYKKDFDNIEMILKRAQPYKRKLTRFCNKYFAHTDVTKSLQEIEADYVKISISWTELINLIDDAKNILRSLFLVYGKGEPSFAEHVYEEYTKQFWEIISFSEIKVTRHS
jgi:hypothetical protein